MTTFHSEFSSEMARNIQFIKWFGGIHHYGLMQTALSSVSTDRLTGCYLLQCCNCLCCGGYVFTHVCLDGGMKHGLRGKNPLTLTFQDWMSSFIYLIFILTF